MTQLSNNSHIVTLVFDRVIGETMEFLEAAQADHLKEIIKKKIRALQVDLTNQGLLINKEIPNEQKNSTVL